MTMNKHRGIYLVIGLILIASQLFSQSDSSNTYEEERVMASATVRGIATGLHVNKYPALELGYFMYTKYEAPISLGASYTVESYFLNELILAPKVNYWLNYMFVNAGLSVPMYFNMTGQNSLKIRPEIGFGYGAFKINYAANISITNKNMSNVGTHFLSLNYYLMLKDY
jgi:hypothetical protein